ncbi:MAG TPA: hypothetical protein VGM08_03945 [Candidatus Saccharimonadales bacterium]
MYRVATTEACEPTGEIEVWAHYGVKVGGRKAEPNRFRFAPDIEVVHALGLPALADPSYILGLVELYAPNDRPLGRRGVPATTSVVHYCPENNHADGKTTPEHFSRYRGRPELLARVLWVPVGYNRERPLAGDVWLSFDEHTAVARQRGNPLNGDAPDPGAQYPIVSAPLTKAEQEQCPADSLVFAGAMRLSCSEPGLVAAMHHNANGESLERIQEFDPEEYVASL